jgi:hypothetical protein
MLCMTLVPTYQPGDHGLITSWSLLQLPTNISQRSLSLAKTPSLYLCMALVKAVEIMLPKIYAENIDMNYGYRYCSTVAALPCLELK